MGGWNHLVVLSSSLNHSSILLSLYSGTIIIFLISIGFFSFLGWATYSSLFWCLPLSKHVYLNDSAPLLTPSNYLKIFCLNIIYFYFLI